MSEMNPDAVLDFDQLDQIEQEAAQRGIYRVMLEQFINSGNPGVDVYAQWPNNMWTKNKDTNEQELKKPATVKQGFENVKENTKKPLAGAEHVNVLVHGTGENTRVYLRNTAVTRQAAQAQSA